MDKLLYQFLLNGILRGGAMVCALVIEAIMVRSLSSADYAAWGVALSVSVIAIVFTQFGYQTSAIKVFARYPQSSPNGIRSALCSALVVWLLAGGAFVVTFRAVFPLLFPSSSSEELCLAIAFMTLARGINTALAEGMRGLGKIAVAASFGGLGLHGGIVRAVLFSLFLLALILNGGLVLISVIWASTIVSVLTSLFLLVYIMRNFHDTQKVTFGSVWHGIRADFALNFRLMNAQFLQLASSRFAANLIGGALSLGGTLAPFFLAQQVAQLMIAPLTVLNGAIPNLIIRAHSEKDPVALEKLMRAASTVCFFFGCIAGLVFVAAGPLLFGLIFGVTNDDAYFHFLCLVPGFMFNCYTGSAARALALLGEEKSYARTSFWVAVGALPLYWVSGMYWSGIGLSISVSFVLVAQNCVYLLLVRSKLGVWSHASLSPVMVFSSIRDIRAAKRKKGTK